MYTGIFIIINNQPTDKVQRPLGLNTEHLQLCQTEMDIGVGLKGIETPTRIKYASCNPCNS